MTTPQIINISSDKKYESCKKKCEFNFKYSISTCVVTNSGNQSLYIPYDKSGISKITFNNVDYSTNNIILYTPSIHLFNNSYADAEIVVTHVNNTTNKNLYVCIPISTGGVIGPASSMIKEIISSVSKQAPNAWQKTDVNLPNFSLQQIIPKKKFYSFTDSNSNNVVIYDITNAIGIDTSTTKTIKSLLQSSIGNFYFSFCTGDPDIYINPLGPNNAQDDEIYIDCQPVNESEEKTEVTIKNPQIKYDTGDWINMILNSVIFQCIVVIFLLMILLYGLKYTAKKFSITN